MTTSDRRAEIFLRNLEADLDPLKVARNSVKALATHNTPDVKRLTEKLYSIGINPLMERAEYLVKGNISSVNAERTYKELTSNPTFDRVNIYQWRAAFDDVLEKFTWERLDWLWEMSWTFTLWPFIRFNQVHFDIYCNIRGPKPRNLDEPWQIILSAERKTRIRRWEKKVYQAAKYSNKEGLYELGLREELVERALERMRELEH